MQMMHGSECDIKYDEPRLKMSHEGVARVQHFQPRFIIFECHTHYCASSVLSYDLPLP